MGLIDFVKEQFLDTVEFIDDTNKILISKFDKAGNEIKQGTQVIVREAQTAVFLKGGRLADILPPGTHELNTDNLPVLSSLKAIGFGFNSPIKADLYFLNLKQFIGNPWETKNPIIVRDAEMNMARIEMEGSFAFRIYDAEKFMREIFGAQQKVMTYEVIQYLTTFVTEAAAIVVGSSNLPVLDLAVKYRDFSELILKEASAKSAPLGIAFSEVVVESITLPEEVEDLIDEQSGIGMASKNMDTFMQYQTARAMRDASKQEGGLAGLGAGMALGGVMGQTVANTAAPVTQPAASESNPAVEQLKQLKQLVDDGILTEEEFSLKKKQILGI